MRLVTFACLLAAPRPGADAKLPAPRPRPRWSRPEGAVRARGRRRAARRRLRDGARCCGSTAPAIVGRVRVGRWACQVAVGGGAAWVTRDNADEVVRIDTMRADHRRAGLIAVRVTVAAGSVWVTSFEAGAVTPRPTGRRGRRCASAGTRPGSPLRGQVWVGHGRGATWLTAIDPRTDREAGRRQRPHPAGRGARGELWVTTEDSGSASRRARALSAGTSSSAARWPRRGPRSPAGSAVGHGQGALARSPRRPGRRAVVDPFPAGPGALALARFGRLDLGHELRRLGRPPLRP